MRLLRDFLSHDGVLFASIDANEIAHFEILLRETFPKFTVISIPVVNNMKGRNDRDYISTCHEYLVLVARGDFKSYGLPLTQQQRAQFKLVDVDGYLYTLRDLRKRGGADTRALRPQLWFPIYKHPESDQLTLEEQSGWIRILPMKKDGTEGCWRWGKERVGKYIETLFPSYAKANDKWNVSYRVYLDAERDESMFEDDPDDLSEDYDDETDEIIERTTKPKSFWWGAELSTDNAGKNLKEMFNEQKVFDFPKPMGLLKKILHMIGDKDALVLDSFAGSATTGHSVLEMNRTDGGSRRFLLVEMDKNIGENVAAPRLSKAIGGYDRNGKKLDHIEGLGGGFRYCRLGTPLFDEFGDVADEVTFADLAAHIFFSETGVPIPKRAQSEYLGIYQGRAVYLLFDEAHPQTAREAAGNVLTPDRLANLATPPDGFDGIRVVYAEGCTVSADRLKAAGVVFKQIPYQIDRG
jgi:adenine-specific DNA-methyltransferase